MKDFLKHLKPIIYLISTLVLMQSCVVYKTKSFSIEEIPKYSDGRFKLHTVDGSKYKVKRIAVRGEKVECYKNTKKITVDKNSITQIGISDLETSSVNLESALNHKGNIQIETESHSYEFVKISEHNDKIIGVKSKKKNRITIVIPKDQIVKIKVQNKPLSVTGNVLIGIGIFLGLITWASTPITF